MINVKFQGELRSVSVKEFTKRDGTKGYDYPIMIETSDSSYVLKANVDIYNDFCKGKIHKGDICNFTADFEPRFQYNNFTIQTVEVVA